VDSEHVKRNDFPVSPEGYDRASVDAHLAAVAAQLTALEARIASYEVEREALRRQAVDASPAEVEVISEAATPPAGNRVPEPEAVTPAPVTKGEPQPRPPSSPAEDEVSARLIATKMTLDGVDRETIRLRLADGYDLEDLDALLDDVIERVG
jgi:DivIVA domain-containing protein